MTMAQIDDYTAMYQWDLMAGVLQALIDDGPKFAVTADFSTQIMRSMDATLAAEGSLTRLTDMEHALKHTSAAAINNAFFTEFAGLMSSIQKWYISGTGTGQGAFASMSTMFADRHYRVPFNLTDAWLRAQGASLSSTYLSCVAEVILCVATKDVASTYVYSNVLDTDMSFAPLVVEAVGDIGAGDLDLAYTATYSDDTTGAETEVISNTMSGGDQVLIASNDVTGDGITSGNDTVPMGATAGMVAGQHVLIQDRTWPVAMTADCDGAASFTAEDTLPFIPGDVVYLHDDDTANEEATIENINHESKTITLTAACAGTFTTAENAFMRLKTADGYGWTEILAIGTVNANTSLVLDDDLNHTYSDQAFVQRVIKSIASVALTNGTNGDAINITAIPDRPGYATLNA